MAKGKNRNRSKGRVLSTRTLAKLPLAPSTILQSYLPEIEDRRSVKTTPRTFSGASYSLVAHQTTKQKSKQKTNVPFQVAFSAPRDVLICVRRKRRKEVLHAFRKTGRSGQRKPRFNRYSQVRC